MKVTVVLPAFNAARTLRKTYEAIPQEHIDELILVDDASHDSTIEEAAQISQIITIRHPQNRGYGGNQKTCYQEALRRGADIVIMLHPDGQYDPQRIPQMIEPIRQGTHDFVIGSRFLSQDPRSGGMHWWRYAGNRFLTDVQNGLLGLNLSECHSGYRAYSRDFLLAIPWSQFSDDFVFDSQMLVAAARKKFRITEVAVPTSYAADASSISFNASVKYGLATLHSLWSTPGV